MGTINQDYIEEYIRSLIIEENDYLNKLEKHAHNNNIPIIHTEVKRLLSVIIKSNNIKSILEVGTAIGYSSIAFYHAMNYTGKILSIENNEEMYKQALKNIENVGLMGNIEILFGDANVKIKELEGTYDCIFLDGAKGHYIHLLEDCLRLLKSGGLLISDNVLFRGMIASDDLVIRRKITIVKRMRKYLDVISNHSDLITSIIPIGDGLALSYKR